MKNHDTNEQIIDRIRNLLRMAEDTSSPHEAAIAAGRARKLMDMHQIEMSDLKEEATGFSFAKAGKSYRCMPKWKDILSVAIGELNDCRVCLSHEYKTINKSYSKTITFQGFEHDVIVCVAMYEYLIATIERLCAGYMKAEHPGTYQASIGDAYKKGISVKLCHRLEALQEERKRDFKNSAGTSLVVFKMAQVEAEFGKTNYKSTNLATPAHAAAYAAERQGRSDGDKVSLNTQLAGKESKATLT